MIWEILAVLTGLVAKNVNGLYRSTYRYYTYYNYYNYYSNYYSYTYAYSTTIGLIVGGVIGGIVLIAFVIALICCCRRSRGRAGTVLTPNNPTVTYVNQSTVQQSGIYPNQPGYPNQAVYPNQAAYPAMAAGPPPYAYVNNAYPSQPEQPLGVQNAYPPMPQPTQEPGTPVKQ